MLHPAFSLSRRGFSIQHTSFILDERYNIIAMIDTSDQSCRLAEACTNANLLLCQNCCARRRFISGMGKKMNLSDWTGNEERMLANGFGLQAKIDGSNKKELTFWQ